MINHPNVTLIGLGHRARNGKDTVANMLKEKIDNVEIIHWADGVYEECANTDTEYPLIKKEFDTPVKTWYSVLDNKRDGFRKAISSIDDPYLHKIFTERDITIYHRMTDKDPEILQFWGTNFRRRLCNHDYWVNLTVKKAQAIAMKMDKGIIAIPDTRFINEVDATRNNGGLYIRVVRIKEDGSQYISTDRDPNHPSEAELDGHPADMTLTALNIEELRKEVELFRHKHLMPLQVSTN